MAVLYSNEAIRNTTLGRQAEKTAAVAASGGSDDLFTVDGGNVLLVGFGGVVETALPADTDLTISHDPDDGGSNVALATVLVADSDPTGTIYTLNPTAGGTLIESLDVSYGFRLVNPIVLTPGDIFLGSAGGGAGGGSIHWYAIWVALDNDATLTAAA